MFHINDYFTRLPGSYLFAEIARRVKAYSAAHPNADIIRLGIGDVTRPLAPAVIEAMHKAVSEMGVQETFHGYGPDYGYDFLVNAIREHELKKPPKAYREIFRILRELDAAGLYKSFTVLGTQALFGYEAAGGVQFLIELLASGDIDLLYDPRQKMTLVSSKLDGQGLLGLLKRADRSFECIRKRGFRAANAGQFMVDLIVPPRGMQVSDPVSFADDDLVALRTAAAARESSAHQSHAERSCKELALPAENHNESILSSSCRLMLPGSLF